MENSFYLIPETLNSDKVTEWEKMTNLNQEHNTVSLMNENEKEEESLADSMLCDSNSRLILGGFTRSNCAGKFLKSFNSSFVV